MRKVLSIVLLASFLISLSINIFAQTTPTFIPSHDASAWYNQTIAVPIWILVLIAIVGTVIALFIIFNILKSEV